MSDFRQRFIGDRSPLMLSPFKEMTIEQIKELQIKGFRTTFKDEPGEWTPMFKGRRLVSSPDKWASSKQRNKIYLDLQEMGIDAYKAIFLLENRGDGIIRRKTLFELKTGDAWDVLQGIKNNKLKKIIKQNGKL